MNRINFSDIAKLRLNSHQFNSTSFKTGTETVKWFAAVQGQEYAQTKWGLGLRLPHLNDTDIENELSSGKILRTHLLRPTWHFTAAEDIRWLLRLTAPRVHTANAFMYKELELDRKLFTKCNDIITKALTKAGQLTRDELNNEFKKNKISAGGHRLSYIMMNAELEGIICSGARKGKKFTYALLDERVPHCEVKDKEEALTELTKRYFFSRGPATLKDFSTWSGLTLNDCRKGAEANNSILTSEKINDQVYYLNPGIPDIRKTDKKIFLLPVYDEFIMGYKDRSAILISKNRSNTNSEFPFSSMMIFEGQIIGTWKRFINSKNIVLEYIFFESPAKRQISLLKKAADHFESFNGLEVNLMNTPAV